VLSRGVGIGVTTVAGSVVDTLKVKQATAIHNGSALPLVGSVGMEPLVAFGVIAAYVHNIGSNPVRVAASRR